MVKLNKSRIGIARDGLVKEKIALKQRGTLSHNWKGDDVGDKSLHEWVNKYKPKPELCDKCKKSPPYDLANKGIYDRDFNNWEYLCRSCHVNSDGRLKCLQSKESRIKALASYRKTILKRRS